MSVDAETLHGKTGSGMRYWLSGLDMPIWRREHGTHASGLIRAAFLAVGAGIGLTVVLEALYIMVTSGTTFYPVVDFLLSISVILTVALLFIHQGTKAEAELVESEERMRDILDNAVDIIQCVDARGRFIYVNRQWHKLLGYGPDELEELTLWDVLRDDQVPKCREMLSRMTGGEDIDSVETVFIAKDGRSIYVEGRANARFENGEFVSSRGIFRDITRRKEMEAVLRESEERFRQIAEHTNDLIAICDLSGYFKYVNPAYASLGYLPDEFPGKFAWDYLHPDDAIEVMESIEKLARGWQGEKRCSVVLRFIDSQGRIREMESTMTLLKDSDATPGQIIIISRDMTEHRAQERETERTKDRYLALVEKSPEGIVVIQDGVLAFVNSASETLLGFLPGEISGTSFLEYVKPEYRNLVAERYQMRLEGKDVPDKYEIELLRKDGSALPVEIFATAIEFEGGPADLIFIRDITERKRLENNIAEVMKQLEAKNRELESYTYTVSHDLKAPLVTIQGFAELLERKYGDSLDEKARHYLERITEGTDRLGKLVTDLLELSRAGRKMREFEPWDLGDILDTVLEGLAGQIHDAGVEIRRADDFPVVMCDDMKLGQALSNLVENAVKYMGDQKEPVVEIGWRPAGAEYEFWVRDNGMGIPEGDHERIFQAFERGQSDAPGTGIGLSIVRKVIEAHGGSIWVESVPGEGAAFRFTLPKPDGGENDEKEVRD